MPRLLFPVFGKSGPVPQRRSSSRISVYDVCNDGESSSSEVYGVAIVFASCVIAIEKHGGLTILWDGLVFAEVGKGVAVHALGAVCRDRSRIRFAFVD